MIANLRRTTFVAWGLLSLLGGSQSSAASVSVAPPRGKWATNVHNLMIEGAFPDLGWSCEVQMKAGSREVDTAKYQTAEFAYRHAMSAPGESAEAAARKMWAFVEAEYAEARLLIADGRLEEACFLRGMALHPLMDSTSPAHRGFAHWDPIVWRDLFNPARLIGKLADAAQHGDWVDRTFGRVLSLPFNASREDLNVLDDHPELLVAAEGLIATVDDLELWR